MVKFGFAGGKIFWFMFSRKGLNINKKTKEGLSKQVATDKFEKTNKSIKFSKDLNMNHKIPAFGLGIILADEFIGLTFSEAKALLNSIRGTMKASTQKDKLEKLLTKKTKLTQAELIRECLIQVLKYRYTEDWNLYMGDKTKN